MPDLPKYASDEVERAEKELAASDWRRWVQDAADTIATEADCDFSTVEYVLTDLVADHLARIMARRMYR
jgi:hypothetical protein